MTTTEFGKTSFASQAAGAEITWTFSWLLTPDRWYDFKLVPKIGIGAQQNAVPTNLVVTGQGARASEVGIGEFHPWLTIRNDSEPGSTAEFFFWGARSSI